MEKKKNALSTPTAQTWLLAQQLRLLGLCVFQGMGVTYNPAPVPSHTRRSAMHCSAPFEFLSCNFTALKVICACSVTQSCPPLRDPMECCPPGCSVHGILQARILQWVAMPFSRDLPDSGIEPRSPTLQIGFLPFELPGKPIGSLVVTNTVH